MPPLVRVERIIGGLTQDSGQFRTIGTPGTMGIARTTPGTAVMPAGLDDAVPPDMVSEHTVLHQRDICSAATSASSGIVDPEREDGDVDAAGSLLSEPRPQLLQWQTHSNTFPTACGGRPSSPPMYVGPRSRSTYWST